MSTVATWGAVQGAGAKPQHVDLGRKLGLRRRLLAHVGPGAAYVPFCGDGDIALEVYADRELWAADLDAERVATFAARFPEARAVIADCDAWPFPGEDLPPFAVADLDAYAYPYDALRAWWAEAEKAPVVAMFATDGQPQSIRRTSRYRHPDGSKVRFAATNDMRRTYNAYWLRVVLPFIEGLVAPWQVLVTEKYLRRGIMLYWGAVVARPDAVAVPEAGVDGVVESVERALVEAAESGNVTAATTYLERRGQRGLIDRLNRRYAELREHAHSPEAT